MTRKSVVPWLLLVIMTFIGCSRQPSYPSPLRRGSDVVIEISVIPFEEPKFYTYHYKGKQINFFVCRAQDKVLSFLDACTSCYTHKRGYRYDDGKVTCRECNMKFSMYQLEKGLGGCYPIKIEGRTEKGEYLIPVAALEGAADKF